ncbi:hypothetical protein DFP72DRAFT_355161 [Ephemerocybe angulata]|uniref:F-box domain-containing protein n=1 Tax=Ephemerocybe angulata TaxID=980116 RepID=A0A8H6HXA0_9AGAR|nr:hypothetical protein DFP72DRAFT_355161 [Tulosesus angulatus]
MIPSIPSELLLTIFDLAVHTPFDPEVQPLESISSLDDLIIGEPPSSTMASIGTTTVGIHTDANYPECHLESGIIAHETNPFTPLDISHVCKDWRKIAFSAPELWSSIYVADGHLSSTVHLLRLWLENSGSRPLDLVFRETPGARYRYGDNSGSDATVEMLKVTAAHSRRWRSFKVRLRRGRLWMNKVMEELGGIETPLLETLAFSFHTISYHNGPQFHDAWIPLITGSPQLQELQMWSSIDRSKDVLLAVPFHRLTTITLYMVSFHRDSLFLNSLRRCEVLETLTISFDRNWGVLQPPSSSDAAISVPSLRHLNLLGPLGGNPMCNLLQNLHLPSLISLWLHTRYWDLQNGERYLCTDVYMALEDLFTRSQCHLHSFKIRDEEEVGFEGRLLSILNHPGLRDLRELRVGSKVGERALEWLGGGDRTSTLPFQDLKHIHLEAFAADSKILSAPVVTMIGLRIRGTGLVAKLESLTVGFLSETQLIYETRAWNGLVAERGRLGVDTAFYFASNAERVRRLNSEFLYRDFSLIQGLLT